MSIFGEGTPKFIYDLGGAAEDEVTLEHSAILQDTPEAEILEHKSNINGHREFIKLGSHWVFSVRLFLFKYADPATKYTEIRQYDGCDVVLYRRDDGEPFLNSTGDKILFTITEVTEGYLQTTDYHDILTITFKSKDYVDLSDSLVS